MPSPRKVLSYVLIAALLFGLLVAAHVVGLVVLHWAYTYFGIKGSGPWYGFWSGAGSDLGEVAILGSVIGLYRKHNCHVKGCWRLSKYAVKGTTHIVCRKHHPDDHPSAQDILDDHKVAMEMLLDQSRSTE